MKAPDKIYLSVEKGEDWAYAMWTQKNPEEQKFSEFDEHEEYIRKEALLEWANSWLAFKRSGIVLDDGFSYAMEELIKKLNEM